MHEVNVEEKNNESPEPVLLKGSFTTRCLDKLAVYHTRLQSGKEIFPITRVSARDIIDFEDPSLCAFEVHFLRHYFSDIFPGNVPAALPVCLSIDPFFKAFGIAGALHSDLRGGAIYLTEIIRRKFNCDRSEVLLQAVQLCRPRNRHDPRLLGNNPGERNLRGRSFLLLGELSN